VKQKRQASADFLGVLAIPWNVVGVCCILTTILAGPIRGQGLTLSMLPLIETAHTPSPDSPNHKACG
jgi:hypothetical protein